MPFDSEPPDGDYAAYIDKLVNRGTGTPGAQRLLKTSAKGFRSALGLPRGRQDALGPGQQYATGTGLPSAPTAPVSRAEGMPAGISEPASQATLARQGRDAVGGTVQTLLGLLFAVLTAGSIASALMDEDPLEPGNIVRTIILLVLARTFFRQGSRKLRGASAMPPSPLPPFVPLARSTGRPPRSPHRKA